MKKVLIVVALLSIILSPAIAQTCDTLFNLQSNLDTATILPADTGAGGGYLAGNNIYGDLAKAEAFPVADSGSYITSAIFYFGVVAINPTDTNNTVTLTVWDNTGTSLAGGSAPGAVIDTVQVTLGQIAQAVSAGQGLLVYFPGDSVLLTDTIYVGVVLPSISGDTVALLTNSAPPGPDGNGWEYVANPTGTGPVWNSYNNDWGVTSGSLGNYIRIDLCNAPSSAPSSSFTTIAGPGTCAPYTVYFSDNSTPAGGSWTWSFGDGTYSNLQNPTHTFTAGGAYTVTETVTDTASSLVQVYMPASTTVNVTSTPTITATANPADSTGMGSAYISVTGGSGHYFTTWSDGTLGDTLVEAPGTYSVNVVDQNGCSASASVTITGPAGILQLSKDEIVRVYPNPVIDMLNLEWSKTMEAAIAIIDMDGNIVSTFTNQGAMKNVYDIHSLANGLYILRITDINTHQQQSMKLSKF